MLEEYLKLAQEKKDDKSYHPLIATLESLAAVEKYTGKDRAERTTALLKALVLQLSELKQGPTWINPLADAATGKIKSWDNNPYEPLAKIKYHSGKLTDPEALGGGKASQAYKITVDTTKEDKKQQVFKPEPKGYAYEGEHRKPDRQIPFAPGLSNIDKVGSRLSSRAVASSKIDKDLGTCVLARTRFGAATITEGGQAQFGSLQSWTGGESLKKMNLDYSKKPYIVKQLMTLQLVDYLCLQVDRHSDNIHITPEDRVLAIDHDYSFGSSSSLAKDPSAAPKYNKNQGIPSVIDAKVAESVLNYSAGELESRLTGLLSTAEITAAKNRLQNVKDKIGNGMEVIRDWQKFATSDKCKDLIGKKSYLYKPEE